MLVSMTGFGRGETSADGMKATVEVKSVNNRFCDISIRLPQSIRHKESELRDLIQKHIERGKLNVSIKIEKQDLAELDITIDPKVVKSYHQLLTNLQESAGLSDSIKIEHFLTFNDLFVAKEEDEEELKTMASLVEKATLNAIEHLNEMRANEGGHLAEDLSMRLGHLDDLLEKVKDRAAKRVPGSTGKIS